MAANAYFRDYYKYHYQVVTFINYLSVKNAVDELKLIKLMNNREIKGKAHNRYVQGKINKNAGQ